MNYSYIIQPTYCEETLRNFDPIKNYFLFSSLYAKINRPILVPIKYLQFLEGGATKCMFGDTFNLLYRDWLTDMWDNREPSAEETEVIHNLFALQPRFNVDLFPFALAACPERNQEFLEFFRDPDNRTSDFECQYRA